MNPTNYRTYSTHLAVIRGRCEDGAMYYHRGGMWTDDLAEATMMPVKVAERLVRMKRHAQANDRRDQWMFQLKARHIFIGDPCPNAHLMGERRAEEAAVARVTIFRKEPTQ